MTAGALEITAPAVALTGLYAALALLLLSLNLKSAWSWPVKSVAVGLALPATVAAFLTIQAQLGWPSHASLPTQFQLHAALIEEPSAGDTEGGAIFLWLTPWQEDEADIDAGPLPSHRPRAFDLPYSRELHQKVETMRERLARGELVTGRHQPGSGLEQRFGRQNGRIELLVPPPPPLPAKDG